MSVNDYKSFKQANPNLEPTAEDIARIKAPVKPITKAPAPAKTEPVIDYNSSIGRETDVQANLD